MGRPYKCDSPGVVKSAIIPSSLKHALESLRSYMMTLEMDLLVMDLCNVVIDWTKNYLIQLFNIMGRI